MTKKISKKLIAFISALLFGILFYWLHNWFASKHNYSLNYGFSFGFGGGRISFVLSLLAIILVVGLLLGAQLRRVHLFGVMVLIGGVSNFIDRVIYSGVRDYWEFGDFWLFNLPDIAINIGAFFLIICILIQDGSSQRCL